MLFYYNFYFETENENAENPWKKMNLNSLRVNVDASLVSPFDSYFDFKRRFPNSSMTREHFKTTKTFVDDCMGDLTVDIYEQEKTGPKVTFLKICKENESTQKDLSESNICPVSDFLPYPTKKNILFSSLWFLD